MTKRLLLLLVSLGFFSFLIADEENPAAGESAAEQGEPHRRSRYDRAEGAALPTALPRMRQGKQT